MNSYQKLKIKLESQIANLQEDIATLIDSPKSFSAELIKQRYKYLQYKDKSIMFGNKSENLSSMGLEIYSPIKFNERKP